MSACDGIRSGLLVVALATFVGCGAPAGENAAGKVDAKVDAEASWLGHRPEQSLARRYYDEAREAMKDSKPGENIALGRLAFHPDTVPALLAIMERGNVVQKRCAWYGLRSVVQGIGCSGYIGPGDDHEACKTRVMPLLAANLKRIEASFAELAEPSRRVYRGTVDEIRAAAAGE